MIKKSSHFPFYDSIACQLVGGGLNFLFGRRWRQYASLN